MDADNSPDPTPAPADDGAGAGAPVYLCCFDADAPGARAIENRLLRIGGARLAAGIYLAAAAGPAVRIARYVGGDAAQAAFLAVVAITARGDWSMPAMTGETLDTLIASFGAAAVARHP